LIDSITRLYWGMTRRVVPRRGRRMVDQRLESGSDLPARPQGDAPARRSRRWRPWLLLAALVLLAGGAVFAWWRDPLARTADAPLDGELTVVVRSAAGAKGGLQVEEPGALPVRAGDLMSVEVHYNQPAFTYLVWLNSEGQTVPLYPWNYDSIDIKDLNQPPPARRPSKIVISPTLGTGWKFGQRGGLETVLLLARRTPLGEGTPLGSLLGTVPTAKMRLRDEVAVLGLQSGSDSVTTLLAANRGPEEEARAMEEPLRTLLGRLRDRFEWIRAVRFAHEGE